MAKSRVKVGIDKLMADALSLIETVSVDEAERRVREEGALIVDIRDIRELAREGTIPDALHAPRGMLEFWIGPGKPVPQTDFCRRQAVHFSLQQGLALGARDAHRS